jgi:hypothetical protein
MRCINSYSGANMKIAGSNGYLGCETGNFGTPDLLFRIATYTHGEERCHLDSQKGNKEEARGCGVASFIKCSFI